MFAFGHVFKRRSFLFFLALEAKRAQRYQKSLSLLSLTFHSLNASPNHPSISLNNLANLLQNEVRETDMVGQGGLNRLLVMLPYADMEGIHKVRQRLEKTLRRHGFGEKGVTVEIDEICFPTHGVDDLLRMAARRAPSGHLYGKEQ